MDTCSGYHKELLMVGPEGSHFHIHFNLSAALLIQHSQAITFTRYAPVYGPTRLAVVSRKCLLHQTETDYGGIRSDTVSSQRNVGFFVFTTTWDRVATRHNQNAALPTICIMLHRHCATFKTFSAILYATAVTCVNSKQLVRSCTTHCVKRIVG